eukprot:scaffold24591_cov48-Phaeocystis_antarctica.AAC.1
MLANITVTLTLITLCWLTLTPSTAQGDALPCGLAHGIAHSRVGLAGLQPYVIEAATVGNGGCSPMLRRLQPYVSRSHSSGYRRPRPLSANPYPNPNPNPSPNPNPNPNPQP